MGLSAVSMGVRMVWMRWKQGSGAGPQVGSALRQVLSLAAISAMLGGCVKQAAVNALADQLSSATTSSFANDDDLALIGEAVPFALKLMESIASSAPGHVDIHLALASGFTQYAMVYVLHPAEVAKDQDLEGLRVGQARAANLFRRARDYGFQAIEIRHPGFSEQVLASPAEALAPLGKEDVALLYWTATPWLGAISVSKEDMGSIGELPSAIATLDRALALDADWDRGAIHDMLIAVEPQRPAPGWEARSRAHFDRAVALSQGKRLSPYVSLATTVSVANQDREEFEALLHQALSIPLDENPEEVTANLFYRARAELLLSQVDDLFI
jgi:hypothetical protein